MRLNRIAFDKEFALKKKKLVNNLFANFLTDHAFTFGGANQYNNYEIKMALFIVGSFWNLVVEKKLLTLSFIAKENDQKLVFC